MDGSFYRPIVPDANLTDFYPLGHYGQRFFFDFFFKKKIVFFYKK